MAISMLLLTDQRPIGYLTSFLAPLVMIFSVWFWVDLNEELADLPPWKALPLTVRIWRWALSCLGFIYGTLGFLSLPCFQKQALTICKAWLEAPIGFHHINQKLFNFLFGANWNEPLAAFVGYMALAAYCIGILQWILVRLPKYGRVAGDF